MKKVLCMVMTILLVSSLFGCVQKHDSQPIGITQVAAGSGISFAIKSDGSLWAWGDNVFGQIGDGTITIREEVGKAWETIVDNDRHTPVKIMDSVVSVSAGSFHAMAITEDGSLWAWGSNSSGELGDNTTETRLSPTKVMESVSSVSAGGSYTMAITKDGNLWAWGGNREGQLGSGTITTSDNNNDSYTPIMIMDSVASVSAGYSHVMAIKADGSLLAWGWNESGQLGNGGDGDSEDFTGRPVQTFPVKIMDDVASVSAGTYHTMAIKTDGSLWAWGSNYSGELGDGTASGRDDNLNLIDNNRYSPVKVMDSVAAVTVGRSHTMAIKTDGSIWALGSNEHGLIGKETTSRPIGAAPARSAQNPIEIMDSVTSISTAGHTLAIKKDGSVWAWGSNYSGQLGDGTTKDRLSPIKIMDGAKLPE